jgi:hypothetical protein
MHKGELNGPMEVILAVRCDRYDVGKLLPLRSSELQ